MLAHDLTVEIKRRLLILPERGLGDQFLKVFQAFGVNGGRIQVRTGRQINLRLADMQKAQRIAGGHGAGLFGGHHVIGQFADLGREFGFRPQRGKRF